MNQNNRKSYYCTPQLPHEIITGIERLYNHKHNDQTDVFSESVPLKANKVIRWNKPLVCFPYHHRIESKLAGKQITMDVLIAESVWSFSGNRGAWSHIASTPLDKFAQQLKATPTYRPKAASTGQLALIANTLAIDPEELPSLTMSNAMLIINASIMMRHWHRVKRLIDINTSGLRELLSSAR